MKSKRKGKSVKGAKLSKLNNSAENEFTKVPHTFVFHRGNVGKNVLELERDVRRMLEPYTAKDLKVRRKNVLQDFISVSGLLNVSHFWIFGKSETAINLRVACLPRGPTLTFKVGDYTLARDVVSSQTKPSTESKQFRHHPLLVMNNMDTKENHIKLTATTLQNVFPSINVNRVNLKDIRRCILLNYDKDTKQMTLRHYNIKVSSVGASKLASKLRADKVPNLSRYNDVSEFVLKSKMGDMETDDEGEDSKRGEVSVPHNPVTNTSLSTLRLTELGPRLQLQLVKIEEGVASGKVLFHEFITKTEEEKRVFEEKLRKRQKLKEQRKKQQQLNVENKAKKRKKDDSDE